MIGFVLAAGLGTRLQPLTELRSKPAVPFLNRPLIHYSLDLLARLPVESVIVNLHHLPDTVREAVQNHSAGSRVLFSEEPQILGTGGALSVTRDRLQGQTIILCNGKIYFEQDLRPVLEAHLSTQAAVTLVLLPYRPAEPFNPVLMDSAGRIVAFSPGRPPLLEPSGATQSFIFSGVHVLSPEVLDFVPEGFSDTVRDIYPRLIRAGLPVRGFVSSAYWCECSTPQRYLQKTLQVLQRRGIETLLESPLDAFCQGVVAGRGCAAPADSRLENVVLWEGAHIGSNSSLRNVILTQDVNLPAGTHLQNVVVTSLLHNRQIWPLNGA